MQKFIKSSINPSKFQIEDVANDNSCFYRSLANGIYFSVPYEGIYNLCKFKKYGQFKPIDRVYNNSQMGFYSDKQDKIARFLHKTIFDWLIENKNRLIGDMGGLSVSKLIMMTHELSVEEYRHIYCHFPSDDIPNIEHNRWAGLPEQIAFSKIFKIPLRIITPQIYNKKTRKINTGRIKNNIPLKNVRFKEIQLIGKEYITAPMHILWKKHNRKGHYMALYPMNN